MVIRARTVAVAVTVAAVAAGCGSSPSTSQPAAQAPSKSAETVAVAADPGGALKFTQSTLAAKSGAVTFQFTNASQTTHAFEIEGVGQATQEITQGEADLTVTLKSGTYTYFCPVPGHREAGMEGTLTVR